MVKLFEYFGALKVKKVNNKSEQVQGMISKMVKNLEAKPYKE